MASKMEEGGLEPWISEAELGRRGNRFSQMLTASGRTANLMTGQ